MASIDIPAPRNLPSATPRRTPIRNLHRGDLVGVETREGVRHIGHVVGIGSVALQVRTTPESIVPNRRKQFARANIASVVRFA